MCTPVLMTYTAFSSLGRLGNSFGKTAEPLFQFSLFSDSQNVSIILDWLVGMKIIVFTNVKSTNTRVPYTINQVPNSPFNPEKNQLVSIERATMTTRFVLILLNLLET